MLLAQVSVAQSVCDNPPYKGGFTVSQAKTCVGNTIKVTSDPTVKNEQYNYQYDGKGFPNASQLNSATSFIYTTPGSYTILQVGSGGGAGSGTIACQVVEVLPIDTVGFTIKACSGRKAFVDIQLTPNTSKYESFTISWGDGTRESKTRTQVTSQLQHTYNTSTVYTISITGGYNAPALCAGPPNAKTITIPSANPTQPVITRLTTTDDNTISIQYTAAAGKTLQLLQKDNSGVYAPLPGKSSSGASGTFSVQTNATQMQCFQLVYQDACLVTEGPPSDIVCSLVLDVKAANKQNQVSWQPYVGSGTPFRSYQLTRNGTTTGGPFSSRTTGTSYTDTKVECGTPYCYAVQANVGPTTIVSKQTCVTAINTDVPGDFSTIFVSVDNNQPRLTALLPTTGTTASYTLVLSRSVGGGAFQPIGSVANKNSYTDNSADPSTGSYCYQLTYQNKCGLTSAPSKPVCTVFLESKSTGIDWTTASPFAPGGVATYLVEVVDSLNGTKREIPVSGNTHYEPDPNDPNLQSQTYRIIAVSGGGVTSYSNYYRFRRDPRILVPDAFTPNSDGINDEFVVRGAYVDTFRMTIYSRWGEVVYSTTDPKQGWDGTIGGQPAIAGQYMYRIEIQDLTGQKTVRTGAVLLLR